MTNFKLKVGSVKPVDQSVNHIFAVDVSGSMYDVLPKMRNHIKSRLALLVKPQDTVSIIYFSSKNEYGVVFEGQVINDLKDLSNLHQAVDKFLQTLSLTGFVEPLQEAIDISNRLKNNGNINSFIFMTDGYDNQWSKNEIIKKSALLPDYFDSISFIEYGWYCNRALLAEMAQVSGGSHIFSEDYQQYEPAIERLLQNKTVKRKPVEIKESFACYLDNNEIILTDAKNGVVNIPEDIDTLFTMPSDDNYKQSITSMDDETKYVNLYVAVHKMKTDLSWALLKSLGDVKLIKLFSNCFSKQEYTTFKEAVKDCVFNPAQRFVEGIDHNMVPKEDAYTVLDALKDLMNGENFLLTNHEKFSYNRIGASIVQKNEGDEQVIKLKESLAQLTDVQEIKKIAAEIANISSWSPFFKEIVSEAGEPIRNLVFNENRPNVSIKVIKNGYVEIPSEKATELKIPNQINTHVFRTYTIIKDGILNMKVLPVHLDEVTFNRLKEEKVVDGSYDKENVYLLDLSKLPLINRNMVKSISAEEFFTSNLELEQLKAKQKVFKQYLQQVSPQKQEQLSGLYGEQAALWLESIGIKDYGFSPKISFEKSGDFYYSKELNVKIAGLSALPSVKAVQDKVAKGSKLTLADTLMIEAIKEYDSFVNSSHVQNSAAKESLIKTWLEAETKAIIEKVRDLQYSLNQTLYSIIVGQSWFKEFASLDENTLMIDFNKQQVSVKAILEEKEIAI